jgi:hypothetical protein
MAVAYAGRRAPTLTEIVMSAGPGTRTTYTTSPRSRIDPSLASPVSVTSFSR